MTDKETRTKIRKLKEVAKETKIAPGVKIPLHNWYPQKGPRKPLSRSDFGVLYLPHHTIIVKVYHDPNRRKP